MGSETFIAVDWGSSNFRARLLTRAGEVRDTRAGPDGVTRLSREQMADLASALVRRWPEARPVLCAGMIGSTAGWTSVPYLPCPATLADLHGALSPQTIGEASVLIVPGLACTHETGAPDVMRGEEVELFGLMASLPDYRTGRHVVVLPGTHTKWAVCEDGAVTSFFTAMSGELFDTLARDSLLASLLSGPGEPGAAFDDGVRAGLDANAGMARELFGVRARVLREALSEADAPSYARGLLLGAEIRDAMAFYSQLSSGPAVPLIGNSSLCALYARALEISGLKARELDATQISVAGFVALRNCGS